MWLKCENIENIENIGYISDIYRGYISSIYIMPTLLTAIVTVTRGGTL